MRNYPDTLGGARRKAGSAPGQAMRPECDAHAVAIVVCDGVTVFELGVACDVFGSE